MSSNNTLTRREMLRKTGALGGTVLWVAPVVQTIGMSPAFAAETSGPCLVYCVKYEVDEGRWTALGGGQGRGRGNCYTCPEEAVNGLPRSLSRALVTGSAETGFSVTLPAGCSVVEEASPTLNAPSGVFVKCGRQEDSCDFQPLEPGATSFRVEPCANGKGISHFELLIKCCS